jgi:GGDEF domain-containing protein
MRKDLDALSAAAGSDDLVELRSAVRSGVASIAHDYAQLRNENLLMEAQLREEIRLLHRAIDTERKAGYTDPVTGAWNRKKCEQRLEELLSFGEGFCVVLAWLSNMKRVQISTSQSVLDEALRCLVKRAAAIAGKDATVSRWSEDEFLVILEMDPALGSVLSGELARQLSTRYAVQEQGASQNLVLRVDTVLVDRPAGGEPDRFRKRMEQTSAVLRGI